MKYFLFDIGNVLTNFDFPLLLQAYADGAGRPLEVHSEQDQLWYDRVERGEITDAEYVEYLNEAKGLSWEVNDLIEVWQTIFTINEAGRGLFEKATKSAAAVYTLSNIAQYHVNAIERNWNGFFDDVTGLFMSYQLGVQKPNPAIYQKVLDQLAVDGERCFFIDDLLANVETARAAGIQAHHFIPENYREIEDAAAKFFDFA